MIGGFDKGDRGRRVQLSQLVDLKQTDWKLSDAAATSTVGCVERDSRAVAPKVRLNHLDWLMVARFFFCFFFFLRSLL